MRRRFYDNIDGISPDKAKNGVYVMHDSGLLFHKDKWNKSLNQSASGVAVLSDNCRFVISPLADKNIPWYPTDVKLDGVTSANWENIKQDYDGVKNTDTICDYVGGKSGAGPYCRSVKFKHGEYGYLGAGGEWNTAYQMKEEVDEIMNLIGGEAIYNGEYWTSTQYSRILSYVCDWSTGIFDEKARENQAKVRAFAQL